jgi:23S rRNA (cytosine1962-C5)-methyltransferase
MSYPVIQLQKGKEANAAFRHPWIFSGALIKRPEGIDHGSIVKLADIRGEVLGTGTYSAKSSIAVRLLAFGEAEVVIDKAWFVAKFREAEARRALHGYGPGKATDGYRIVFGEADGVPGLVVDRYRDVLVIQISTAGMDNLRAVIVDALEEAFAPKAIVERSDIGVRKEEALSDAVSVLKGEVSGPVAFSEAGLSFEADVLKGQKTGFFLDQKSLRQSVAKFAAGRKALNLFSYTGATGVAAMKGGAASVLNVDASADALAGCGRHADANEIPFESFGTEEADAFQYLSSKNEPAFDMILLDPPALIKSQRDAEEGKKAYHFLNRAALRLIQDGGIFVTSSCSHFLNEEDFAFILRRASVQTGVRLDVLDVIRQAPDHPASVYCPESAYLKSFICRVTR